MTKKKNPQIGVFDAEKTLQKLLACYYNAETDTASTIPFSGSPANKEIQALWVAAAKQLKN